jgi:hypothetical protein
MKLLADRITNLSAARRDLAGDRPWWEALDPAFYKHHDQFDMGVLDVAAVELTGSLDENLRRLGALGVALTAVPIGFNPFTLRRALRESAVYRRAAEAGDPKLIFEPPPEVSVRTRTPRNFLFRPRDGTCEDLTFESPFTPIHPSLRREYRAHGRNRIARARLWRHSGPPRPTVVAIHGYFADQRWFNEWFFDLRRIYEMGCDVALFTLPFHGPRSGNGSVFSGHRLFAGGLSWINEAFAQAVMDFRALLAHLIDHRSVPAVGVTGISLGGYTSALLAAVEPRLAFSIPNVPVASLPDLVLEWTPIGTALRSGLTLFRSRVEDVRLVTAGHCPLSYPPVLPKDRLMVIGGVGDRLAPPKHARLIWEHWGEPAIHYFPGSHVLHLRRGAYLDQVERFLRGINFV